MILYFIRHGQTQFNETRRIQGCTNIPLNENGRKQALVVKDRLNELGIEYDSIYSSPLDRAQETCELVTGIDRSNFLIDDRLREIEAGELSGLSYDDPKAEDFMYKPWQYVPGKNAEGYPEMIARVGSFLEDMRKEKGNTAEKVLCACHRGSIMAAYMYINKDVPMTEFRTTAVPNATVLKVELDEVNSKAEFLDRNKDNDLGDDAGLVKRQ